MTIKGVCLNINSNMITGLLSKSLFLTFLAKSVSSLGSLGLLIVLGNKYGVDGLGYFALGQTIILANSILCRFGMSNTVLKLVSQCPTDSNSNRYFKTAFYHCMLSSLILALLCYVFKWKIAVYFDALVLEGILKGMLLAVPAFTISFIISAYMKAISKPASACFQENGAISLITAILLFNFSNDLSDIGYLYSLSAWSVSILGLIAIKKDLRISKNNGNGTFIEYIKLKEFYKLSFDFFLISLAGFVSTVVSTLISAKMLGITDLGLLRASLQIGIIVSFVLVVINSIYPRKFAQFHSKGEYKSLEKCAKDSVLLGCILVTPFLAVAFIFPEFLLGLLGAGFADAVLLLKIISVGQLVNVATGSVGFLLNMTGNQRVTRNIVLITNVANVALLVVLIDRMGVVGAAIAISFSAILQNLIAVWYVHKKLNFWVFPTFLRRDY